MKSGLEGRNNGGCVGRQGGFLRVSMKSGLEGRNNVNDSSEMYGILKHVSQ